MKSLDSVSRTLNTIPVIDIEMNGVYHCNRNDTHLMPLVHLFNDYSQVNTNNFTFNSKLF